MNTDVVSNLYVFLACAAYGLAIVLLQVSRVAGPRDTAVAGVAGPMATGTARSAATISHTARERGTNCGRAFVLLDRSPMPPACQEIGGTFTLSEKSRCGLPRWCRANPLAFPSPQRSDECSGFGSTESSA
jgi:hypothetical protein